MLDRRHHNARHLLGRLFVRIDALESIHAGRMRINACKISASIDGNKVSCKYEQLKLLPDMSSDVSAGKSRFVALVKAVS